MESSIELLGVWLTQRAREGYVLSLLSLAVVGEGFKAVLRVRTPRGLQVFSHTDLSVGDTLAGVSEKALAILSSSE